MNFDTVHSALRVVERAVDGVEDQLVWCSQALDELSKLQPDETLLPPALRAEIYRARQRLIDRAERIESKVIPIRPGGGTAGVAST